MTSGGKEEHKDNMWKVAKDKEEQKFICIIEYILL